MCASSIYAGCKAVRNMCGVCLFECLRKLDGCDHGLCLIGKTYVDIVIVHQSVIVCTEREPQLLCHNLKNHASPTEFRLVSGLCMFIESLVAQASIASDENVSSCNCVDKLQGTSSCTQVGLCHYTCYCNAFAILILPSAILWPQSAHQHDHLGNMSMIAAGQTTGC